MAPLSYSGVAMKFKFAGKAFPDPRGADPKRSAWWLVNYLPGVRFWAKSFDIGFWRNDNPNGRTWHPVMRYPHLNVSRYGVKVRKL